jgi:peptidoglycan/LPS O-acetylase OafA/YrhL
VGIQAIPSLGPQPRSDGLEPARLPGLDGIRAVAVTLVLLAHFCPAEATGSFLDAVVRKGGFGVEIFFVLSGFLITHLLMREEQARGTVSLPFFFARRAIRILPPLVVFLVALAAAHSLGILAISRLDLTAGLLFFRNYVGTSPETAHLWTLAIEEQFYLGWPLLLLLVPSHQFRIAICAAFILASPFWTHLVYKLASGNHVNTWRTDLRLQPILTGALFALLQATATGKRILKSPRLNQAWVPLAAAAVVVLVEFTEVLSFSLIRLLRPVINSVGVALIINFTIANRTSPLTLLLELRPVAWVGALSYSLYLWQQPFAPYLPGSNAAWFRNSPINLLAAVTCGVFSYYVVERPILGFRRRFRPQSSTPAPAHANPRVVEAILSSQ